MVVLPANPEFRQLLRVRPHGGLNGGTPSTSPDRREKSWLEIFSPNGPQDSRIFFSKTTIFPVDKKKKINQSSAFGESAFPLSHPAVGSTRQGTRSQRRHRRPALNTAQRARHRPALSASSNGVSAVSSEELIYGNTVHCQAILPGAR